MGHRASGIEDDKEDLKMKVVSFRGLKLEFRGSTFEFKTSTFKLISQCPMPHAQCPFSNSIERKSKWM